MIQQLTNSSLDRAAVRETRIPANICLNRNIVLNKYSFLTLSLRTTPFGGFPDYFRFRHFWSTSSFFQKKRPNPLDSGLNFTHKQPYFCCLSVLICCCAANQYNEIGGFFKSFRK